MGSKERFEGKNLLKETTKSPCPTTAASPNE
jgi:hypothetical protein